MARLSSIADLRRRQRRTSSKKGKCSRCFKAKASRRFRLCLRCREDLCAKRKRRRLAGVCVNCRSQPDPGFATCRICIAKDVHRVQIRRRRLRSAGLCIRCGRRRDGRWLHCSSCRMYGRKVKRRFGIRLRQALLSRFGSRCRCCHETEPAFLTLDHVRDDGNKDRRDGGNAYSLYRRILTGREDLARFQLLCWNCNLAKAHHGRCPHQDPALFGA